MDLMTPGVTQALVVGLCIGLMVNVTVCHVAGWLMDRFDFF